MKKIEIEEQNNGYVVTIYHPAIAVYVYKSVEEKQMMSDITKYLFGYKTEMVVK